MERAGTDESIVLVLGVQGLAGLGSVNVYGKVKGYVFDSIRFDLEENSSGH